jgi:adenine-specific DNA-methyltransferase
MTVEGGIEQTEAMRFKLQKSVDGNKTTVDRNIMGQYSTPRKLADDILLYAKATGELKDEVSFLDPAFGMGSFYTAFLKAYGTNSHGLGFEIDKDYFDAAVSVWKKHIDQNSLRLINDDFTKSEKDKFRKVDLVVSNPPYSRHQHIDAETKQRLKAMIKAKTGRTISGLAGLHTYFMLLCDEWLKEDALSIWLIPSEIFEVNYGKVIKDYLMQDVRLDRIHFFDHSVGQFDDALVSSCVIIFKKTSTPVDHAIQITSGSDFLAPDHIQRIDKLDLQKVDKWSKRLSYTEFIPDSLEDEVDKLGSMFNVKRGIATGNNSYFVLTKEKAESLEIPRQFLKNILPSARSIKTDVITNDADGYLDVDEKLALLNISLPADEIQRLYPKLYDYLMEGERQGVHLTYINSRRHPWYSQEQREAPDYFVRYMTRSREGGNDKPVFIKNESDAISTNGYLMMYEKKTFFSPQIDLGKLHQHLNKMISSTIETYGRSYGGGLIKIEPKELKKIPLLIS